MSMQLIGQGQRIGTGPFGFLFEPVAMCDLAGRMALVYAAVAGVVLAAALAASVVERVRRSTVIASEAKQS